MANGQRGRQRRDELVRAGAHLFALHEYSQSSTSDLLEAASVSKGAFYHYFNSKEELAVAARCRRSLRRELIEPINGVVDPGQRWGRLLERLAELSASGGWHDGLLLARLVQDAGQQPNELAEQLERTIEGLVETFAGWIGDAQRAGMIAGELGPDAVARLVLAAWFGAAGLDELEGVAMPLDALVGQLALLTKK